MGVTPELYLCLTLAVVAAMLVIPVAWAEGADDPIARSRIYKFDDIPRITKGAEAALFLIEVGHRCASARRMQSASHGSTV